MKRSRTIAIGAFAAVLLLAAAWLLLRSGGPMHRTDPPPWEDPLVERDLEQILTDTLRVLVMRDPLTWEERPKAESGLEFELLQRFAKHIGTPMVVVPVDHPDSMLMFLQRGRGDIMAAQLTARKDRRRYIAFSKPYRTVRPRLAVLRADPQYGLPESSAAMLGPRVDSVELSAWSPFADPAYRFSHRNENGPKIHVDPQITPEDLLMEVVIGRHAATIITDARGHYEAGRFPVIEVGEEIGPPQELRFGLRRNSPELLARIDDWLHDPTEREARELFFKAYATSSPKPGPLKVRKRIPVAGDSISPFDAHFKAHASHMRFDWELLAAMAYRESRFDSTVTSVKGAQGIMQIMPRTGARFGLDSSSAMEDHILAAVRYINRLDTLWMRAIPDKEQRLRFVLGSYNSGPGHIIDAQRLAKMLGLDPDVWEHNVERAVLLLAKPRYYMLPEMKNGYCKGSQVFAYVRDVLGIYRQLKARPRSVGDPPKRVAENAAPALGSLVDP